jgi:hypothetical protein
VSIDISGRGHLLPFNRRMPLFQFIRQPARGFRNNFKAARHGVYAQGVIFEAIVVQSSDETSG